ncbi:MAG: heterodisulfide reductase subunit B [Armatimonadetes bacterium]|nr:heterodisulfide reductase subunit B [Armatimonadota bacterium]
MRVAYYPGCSLEGTAIEFDQSCRAMCEALGIELVEVPDWNCCGASSAHFVNHDLAVALGARNLGLAQRTGADQVTAPCAACYARLKFSEYKLHEDPERLGQMLERGGVDYKGGLRVSSPLELLVRDYGLEALKEKLVQSLNGLKVACYYGCLLVRPTEMPSFDDPENPRSLDSLMETLGAEPVDWAYRVECCGGGLALGRADIVRKLIGDILDNAVEAGAECFVVACPLCQGNLDWRQTEAGSQRGKQYNLPVYYYTQLVGWCLGLPPQRLGIEKLLTPATTLLERKVSGLVSQVSEGV